MPPTLVRFTFDDLPWLVLRHQQGEFVHRIAGRHREDSTDPECLDLWRLAPDYAILRANPNDLEQLGIEPDEVSPHDEIFSAIYELPTRYGIGEKSFVRRSYGAETVFFRASNDAGFDFPSASGVLRREIFWKCRETSGGAHLESCRRFPPALDVLRV